MCNTHQTLCIITDLTLAVLQDLKGAVLHVQVTLQINDEDLIQFFAVLQDLRSACLHV